MIRKTRMLAITTLSSLVLFANTHAMAETPFTTYTGLEGGGYSKFMTEKGLTSQVNLDGSAEIADKLCNDADPATGNLQLDTVWAAEQSGCDLFIIGKMPHNEVVFLMAAPDSNVEDLHDLTSTTRLFVDGPASGSAYTFANFKRIDAEHGGADEWTNTPPRHGSNTLLALSKKYDAAFLVRPVDSPLILELINNGWTPLSVSDKDINDLHWNNAPLYAKTSFKIDNPNAFRDWRISTFLVPSVIAINTPASVDSKLVRTLKTLFQ